MDVIEARTDQSSELDIQRQWRLIKSDNETGVFRRATIQEVAEDNTGKHNTGKTLCLGKLCYSFIYKLIRRPTGGRD